MRMTFDEVKRYIDDGSLGSIFGKGQYLISNTDELYGIDRLYFILESLRETYEKKRVIELPDDVIDYLVKTKRLVSIHNVLDFLFVIGENTKVLKCISVDEVAEWYLGHVEFVAKKDPKYMVAVDMYDDCGNLKAARVWKNDLHGAFTPYIDNEELPSLQYNHYEFSEKDADMLVNEFSILKARKVEVE